MRKAKWYKSAACFRKNNVPIYYYVSRQVTLPVEEVTFPESPVICEFCYVKLLMKFHLSFV